MIILIGQYLLVVHKGRPFAATEVLDRSWYCPDAESLVNILEKGASNVYVFVVRPSLAVVLLSEFSGQNL